MAMWFLENDAEGGGIDPWADERRCSDLCSQLQTSRKLYSRTSNTTVLILGRSSELSHVK